MVYRVVAFQLPTEAGLSATSTTRSALGTIFGDSYHLLGAQWDFLIRCIAPSSNVARRLDPPECKLRNLRELMNAQLKMGKISDRKLRLD
jgi:hypothetical protein